MKCFEHAFHEKHYGAETEDLFTSNRPAFRFLGRRRYGRQPECHRGDDSGHSGAADEKLIVRRYLPRSKSAGQVPEPVGQRNQHRRCKVQKRIERYRKMMPDSKPRRFRDRHRDMPYRCLLKYTAGGKIDCDTRRIRGTAYPSVEDFLDDIGIIRNSLQEQQRRTCRPIRSESACCAECILSAFIS